MLRDRQPVILVAIKGPDSASSLGFWVLYLGAAISKLHNTISMASHTHSVLSASESLSKEDVEGRMGRKNISLCKGPRLTT